jgi:spermidine synthase
MTVNLFGRSSSYERSLGHITKAFGADAVWAFRPTREGNTIVLALREPQHPDRAKLAERAETIETRWQLPARKWLRVFKPVA